MSSTDSVCVESLSCTSINNSKGSSQSHPLGSHLSFFAPQVLANPSLIAARAQALDHRRVVEGVRCQGCLQLTHQAPEPAILFTSQLAKKYKKC